MVVAVPTPLASFWDHLAISIPNLRRWIGEGGHSALEYVALLLMLHVAPALVKFGTALPCPPKEQSLRFCDYSTQRWTSHVHHWRLLLFIRSLPSLLPIGVSQMPFIALEKQRPSADGGHCAALTANQFDANDIDDAIMQQQWILDLPLHK